MTGDPDAYAEALKDKSDLVVPTGNYATLIAATEHGAFFSQEFRLGDKLMNAREAKVYEQELDKLEAEEAKRQAEAGDTNGGISGPIRIPSVSETIRTQLEAIGETPENAGLEASLYRGLENLAERAVIDPVEFSQRYGFVIGQSATARPTLEEADAALLAKEKARAPRAVPSIPSERPDAVTTPATGERPADLALERARADEGGDEQGRGDGDVARSGGLPAATVDTEPADVFARQSPEQTAARLTPEVHRELVRIEDEMETFPFTKQTWNWLGEGPKTGKAAGGHAKIVAGSSGAIVYNDILYLAPVNRVRSGKRKGVHLDRKAVMPMWRYAVVAYLRAAAQAGLLKTDLSPDALCVLLDSQCRRWWNIDIKQLQSKRHVLGYAGRYARRPPIAEHRFREIDRQEVRFLTKDTRTRQTVETVYFTAEFLTTLADHVPDHYRHNIRYFGLLAPRVKGQSHDVVFALLGQQRLAKPSRQKWAASIQRAFGVDPLLDGEGQRMHWTRWLPPERSH